MAQVMIILGFDSTSIYVAAYYVSRRLGTRALKMKKKEKFLFLSRANCRENRHQNTAEVLFVLSSEQTSVEP